MGNFGNNLTIHQTSGPEVIKLFTGSAQLELKLILLLTFISGINCKLLRSKHAKHEISI